MQKSREIALSLNKKLRVDIDAMNKYKKACDDEIVERIADSRRKNE